MMALSINYVPPSLPSFSNSSLCFVALVKRVRLARLESNSFFPGLQEQNGKKMVLKAPTVKRHTQ